MIDFEQYCDLIKFEDLHVRCETNGTNVRYEYLKSDDTIAAFVEFSLLGDTIMVPTLFVEESMRSRGIGSHIVAVAGYFYTRENITKLQLRFVSNRHFVESKGFNDENNFTIDMSNPDEPFWAWRNTIIGDDPWR